MKCKKCNYDLDKEWKICPVCLEPIKKKNYLPLIIGSISLFLLLIILVVSNTINYNISDEERTRKYLEKTYNEKFDKVTLIQSTKNPDTELSCDGSSFGTIKGKGYTESYLVYSDKENIEFKIYYDTYKKEYRDDYEITLNLRKSVGELYEQVKNTFDKYNEKITFSSDSDSESITINSEQDLYNLLSKDNNVDFTRLYMYVNMNSFDFCNKEYDNIKMINNYLIELKNSSGLYSHIGFSIYTLDKVTLEFDRLDAVRVYDSFSNGKAWGETVEEFIKRNNY